jgi:hypothetical protein
MTAATPQTAVAAFELDLPPAAALPLFTAAGERRWVPGWNPDLLAGGDERGAAFRTTDAEGRESLWLVLDYDLAAGRASYARTTPGLHLGLVDVTCRPLPAARSQVEVRYTLTALSEAGATALAAFFDPARYRDFIGGWKTAVDAALAREAAAA